MGISWISLTFPPPKPPLSLTPKPKHPNTSHLPKHHHYSFIPKATLRKNKKPPSSEQVQEVHSIEEFDTALIQAKDKLVLVEYIPRRSCHRSQTHPLTVQLSRRRSQKNNGAVCFVLVKADESDETRELCRRENVEKVPHYNFHKNNEKLHGKSRLRVEEFIRYALYYGNSHGSVIQLLCMSDVEKLMDDQTAAGCDKLIVINLGLRNCEPCVKIYPTMVRLSARMGDDVVLARLLGDDNGGRNMEFLRKKCVVRVPAFLFIRNGEILGRYVGSENAILVRELFRYNECS